MAKPLRVQAYPRVRNEEHRFYGYLDEGTLREHIDKIDIATLKKTIAAAIEYAHHKSSREILALPAGLDEDSLDAFYRKKGKELFHYFIRYCGDPASSAFDCLGRSYAQIAKESFRNRTLQKERMNAGWRYQYIAKDSARLSGRFDSVSDLNSIEADFNVAIRLKESEEKLNIYVSVKNRSNTMGGQDWPKAISALENAAINDKNRMGHYICVFGIAMEKGLRLIKCRQQSQIAYSDNTEVWFSDFFWPFFSNYSYDDIAKAVLDVLVATGKSGSLDVEVPAALIDEFGRHCSKFNLLDKDGKFDNAYRLVDLFCGKLK